MNLCEFRPIAIVGLDQKAVGFNALDDADSNTENEPIAAAGKPRAAAAIRLPINISRINPLRANPSSEHSVSLDDLNQNNNQAAIINVPELDKGSVIQVDMPGTNLLKWLKDLFNQVMNKFMIVTIITVIFMLVFLFK